MLRVKQQQLELLRNYAAKSLNFLNSEMKAPSCGSSLRGSDWTIKIITTTDPVSDYNDGSKGTIQTQRLILMKGTDLERTIAAEMESDSLDGGEPEYQVGWVLSDAVKDCMCCGISLNGFFTVRHHCRGCGNVVCYGCWRNKAVVPGLSSMGEQHVCITCFNNLQHSSAADDDSKADTVVVTNNDSMFMRSTVLSTDFYDTRDSPLPTTWDEETKSRQQSTDQQQRASVERTSVERQQDDMPSPTNKDDIVEQQNTDIAPKTPDVTDAASRTVAAEDATTPAVFANWKKSEIRSSGRSIPGRNSFRNLASAEPSSSSTDWGSSFQRTKSVEEYYAPVVFHNINPGFVIATLRVEGEMASIYAEPDYKALQRVYINICGSPAVPRYKHTEVVPSVQKRNSFLLLDHSNQFNKAQQAKMTSGNIKWSPMGGNKTSLHSRSNSLPSQTMSKMKTSDTIEARVHHLLCGPKGVARRQQAGENGAIVYDVVVNEEALREIESEVKAGVLDSRHHLAIQAILCVRMLAEHDKIEFKYHIHLKDGEPVPYVHRMAQSAGILSEEDDVLRIASPHRSNFSQSGFISVMRMMKGSSAATVLGASLDEVRRRVVLTIGSYPNAMMQSPTSVGNHTALTAIESESMDATDTAVERLVDINSSMDSIIAEETGDDVLDDAAENAVAVAVADPHIQSNRDANTEPKTAAASLFGTVSTTNDDNHSDQRYSNDANTDNISQVSGTEQSADEATSTHIDLEPNAEQPAVDTSSNVDKQRPSIRRRSSGQHFPFESLEAEYDEMVKEKRRSIALNSVGVADLDSICTETGDIATGSGDSASRKQSGLPPIPKSEQHSEFKEVCLDVDNDDSNKSSNDGRVHAERNSSLSSFFSSVASTTNGGGGHLSPSMMVEEASLNVSSKISRSLIEESANNPEVLLGWQIQLPYPIDQRGRRLSAGKLSAAALLAGAGRLFVVTAIKKDNYFKSVFRISSTDQRDKWVRLQRGPQKRGLSFTPLRKVLYYEDGQVHPSVDAK